MRRMRVIDRVKLDVFATIGPRTRFFYKRTCMRQCAVEVRNGDVSFCWMAFLERNFILQANKFIAIWRKQFSHRIIKLPWQYPDQITVYLYLLLLINSTFSTMQQLCKITVVLSVKWSQSMMADSVPPTRVQRRSSWPTTCRTDSSRASLRRKPDVDLSTVRGNWWRLGADDWSFICWISRINNSMGHTTSDQQESVRWLHVKLVITPFNIDKSHGEIS